MIAPAPLLVNRCPGSGRPPAALEVQVRSVLERRVRDFRLILTQEGIILRGRASTYYAKQIAQHAVMSATPVPILANEIVVSG